MPLSKKWNRWVGGFCAALLFGSMVFPASPVRAEENDAVSDVEEAENNLYTKEAQAAYELAHNLIEKAKKTGKLNDIRAAYEAFIAITPHLNAENYDAYTPDDQMDQVYYELEEMLYKTIPADIRANEILQFAKKWTNVLLENYNSLYVYHFRYFVVNNPIESIQDELVEMLIEVNRWANGTPSPEGIIPQPTEEELDKMIDEYLKKHGPDEPAPPLPPEDGPDYPQLGDDDLTSKTKYYEKVGNDWYEIIEYIQGGKTVRKERRKLSKAESYWLRVKENNAYDPNNPFAGLRYSSPEEWEYLTTDQNPESKYTIHYTINKDEAIPYYYDTGIRVNLNKEATYEQYKDVLLILADKAEGFFVEDKDKVLAVLEGKPIVVKSEKKTYSKAELETVFADFQKVDIRIMETRIGKTESLEEQIVSKQAKTVQVDGKNITLTTLPMVKNERALLPLEEIAKALGGRVKESGDTFTVTKGDAKVMYRLKDNSVYVNGRPIKLKNAPVYKDGVLMVEAGELATALGYSMSWDGETSTISFDRR